MLSQALAAAVDSGRFDVVVTSGRRLARAIDRHAAQRALASGAIAWSTPLVLPWRSWLRQLATAHRLAADPGAALPQLLSPAAASALWRQAARNTHAGPGQVRALAGLAESSYALMRRYDLTLEQVAREAFDDDSRFFVDCATEVLRRVQHNGWLLEADLAATLAEAAQTLAGRAGTRILLAGFDALTPDQRRLVDALGSERFEQVAEAAGFNTPALVAASSFREEIIAAGRWARSHKAAHADDRLAVVVPGLSGVAEDVTRWFRQGFLPPAAGEANPTRERTGFEVSFGRSLGSYPAIATAMQLLTFSHQPQTFTALSRLLRSALLWARDDRKPLQLEQRLRAHADRPWSPSELQRFAEVLAPAWLEPVRALGDNAEERRAPSSWAESIAATLTAAGWLESVATDSPVYQLKRAFHVALNALGPMLATSGQMTLPEVLATLSDLLDDSVHQAEGEGADVLVCGPLEMPGLGFDALWVAGLDAGRWPPVGRADSLLPRSVQTQHGLPDATPEQTTMFWRRRFEALAAAAPVQVWSHATHEGDSELMPSPLIATVSTQQAQHLAQGQLGWQEIVGTLGITAHAAELRPFDTARRMHNAVAALSLVDTDPFAAIAIGRWHVGVLEDPERGIDPRLRGMILHDALEAVYTTLDSRDALTALDGDARAQHVRDTLARTMASRFIHADEVLRALLRVEESRAAALIEAQLEADAARPPFEVIAREQSRTLVLNGIAVHLRLDRVDRTAAGNVIIDYKTGSRLSLNPDTLLRQHLQLVLYALTERDVAAGLALAGLNRDPHRYSAVLDTHASGMLPAGRQVRQRDMAQLVDDWREQCAALAAAFVLGPVAVARRPADERLNGLSRHAEVYRDDG